MRLPLTLWVHTLAELWRIILLSAGVLVVVISFAATVRYTAAGKLGPLETLTFMFYAIPPMLQYALPFAAGFGATIAYHRMTQDNEATAAAASGVSHRAILAPALITGTVLAVLLWVLAGQVIPRFLRHMELMITEDAKKILVASIQAGRPVEFAGKLIHAKHVYELKDDDEKGSRLVLVDVSAIELDGNGSLISESFAKRAWVTFFPAPQGPEAGDSSRSSRTIVSMTLEKGRIYKPDSGSSEVDGFTYVYPIAGTFSDDPKYLTTRELEELPDHPDRNNVIDAHRRGLATAIAERHSIDSINRSLRKDRKVRLTDSEGREYIIHAAGASRLADRWELLAPALGRDIEVERSGIPLPGGRRPDPAAAIRFVAKTAGFISDLNRDESAVRLTLVMENVSGQSIARPESGDENGAAGVLTERKCTGLALSDESVKDLMALPSRELLAEVQSRGLETDPTVGAPAADLSERIENLTRNVISKQHERVADSVACLVMVFAGAVTAMRLGSSLPLTVYLWSFFPALLSVITISAGQQTTRHMSLQGLSVLWAGVAVVAAYAAGAYWIVRRH